MTEVSEGQVFGNQSSGVVAPDPATLAGPGVSPNPNEAAVRDVAQIAEENARLRAELIAENERLKAAVDEARAFGVAAQGLGDEDVRRIEHPEEYADEYASLGEHQALTLQLQSLSERLDAAHALIADAKAERAQLAQSQAQPAPRETAAVTADPIEDKSQASAPVEPTSTASRVVHEEPSVISDAGASRDLDALTDDELQAELDSRRSRSAGLGD